MTAGWPSFCDYSRLVSHDLVSMKMQDRMAHIDCRMATHGSPLLNFYCLLFEIDSSKAARTTPVSWFCLFLSLPCRHFLSRQPLKNAKGGTAQPAIGEIFDSQSLQSSFFRQTSYEETIAGLEVYILQA